MLGCSYALFSGQFVRKQISSFHNKEHYTQALKSLFFAILYFLGEEACDYRLYVCNRFQRIVSAWGWPRLGFLFHFSFIWVFLFIAYELWFTFQAVSINCYYFFKKHILSTFPPYFFFLDFLNCWLTWSVISFDCQPLSLILGCLQHIIEG